MQEFETAFWCCMLGILWGFFSQALLREFRLANKEDRKVTKGVYPATIIVILLTIAIQNRFQLF